MNLELLLDRQLSKEQNGGCFIAQFFQALKSNVMILHWENELKLDAFVNIQKHPECSCYWLGKDKSFTQIIVITHEDYNMHYLI